MRGTEEQFNNIMSALAKNTRDYEEKRIKHFQFADMVDRIFQDYGWNKPGFYRELNLRLGIHTNESRREEKKLSSAQKVPSKKKVK